MLKKDEIITAQYDCIKEYRLAKNGDIIMTTPSLEIREYNGAHGPISIAYITGSNKMPFRTRYISDEFWDLKKSTTVFRFRADVPDTECRAQISAELTRRAEEIEKKVEYFRKRAAALRLQAKTIRQ